MPGSEHAPIRVLVLENDPDMVDMFELIFSLDDDFVADVVVTVDACMEQLLATVESPVGRQLLPYDVLVLDLLLDGKHLGTEVLNLATSFPRLSLPSVVVCTALSGPYLKMHTPELAMSDARIWMLPKPFDIEALTDVLRAAAAQTAKF